MRFLRMTITLNVIFTFSVRNQILIFCPKRVQKITTSKRSSGVPSISHKPRKSSFSVPAQVKHMLDDITACGVSYKKLFNGLKWIAPPCSSEKKWHEKHGLVCADFVVFQTFDRRSHWNFVLVFDRDYNNDGTAQHCQCPAMWRSLLQDRAQVGSWYETNFSRILPELPLLLL